MEPAELCVVRRTAAMSDLERRLQHAMVAYVGGARHDVSPRFVLDALEADMGISAEWVSVHPYWPEDFLVVFARQDHRNQMGLRPSVEHRGVRLFFRQWNRQAQAVHAIMRYKVRIIMEGIPRMPGIVGWRRISWALLASSTPSGWRPARALTCLRSGWWPGLRIPIPSQLGDGLRCRSLRSTSSSRSCCNTRSSFTWIQSLISPKQKNLSFMVDLQTVGKVACRKKMRWSVAAELPRGADLGSLASGTAGAAPCWGRVRAGAVAGKPPAVTSSRGSTTTASPRAAGGISNQQRANAATRQLANANAAPGLDGHGQDKGARSGSMTPSAGPSEGRNGTAVQAVDKVGATGPGTEGDADSDGGACTAFIGSSLYLARPGSRGDRGWSGGQLDGGVAVLRRRSG